MPNLKCCVLVVLCVVSFNGVRADTFNWINPAGGSFLDGGNWDRGSPPGSNDVASFALNSGPYTVFLTQDINVGSLALSGANLTLELGGHTVHTSFSGSATLGAAGALTINNGHIQTVSGGISVGAGPFNATNFGVGGGGNSTAHVAGVLNLTNSAISSDSTYVTATVNMQQGSLLFGEYVNVSNSQFSGGSIGAAEGLSLVSVRAQGLIVHDPNQFGPTHLGGNNFFDPPGSTLGSVVINSGVTRIGPGTALGFARVNATGRMILEPGTVSNATVWLADSGTVRVESGVGGLMNISPEGLTGTFGMELVMDAALTPPIHSFTMNAVSGVAPGGGLTLEVLHPNRQRLGDEITLFTYLNQPYTGNFNSTFSHITVPALHGNRLLQVVVHPQSIVAVVVPGGDPCYTADFDGDGNIGTDADIEAFFACLAGNCCPFCPGNADFNGDGDVGTDADIEAFFRVLSGGNC